MKQPVPFTIYNASAGSGKTFSLVKEYLKRVLTAPTNSGYKNLLALTFTNKAVAEMKQRIIESLVLFSSTEATENPPPMLEIIAQEMDTSVAQLHDKAKGVLNHLLHHYASFSVETIDRFNHMLIRTFARDLKLSASFEVSLDTDQLLAEAVDLLISKAGEDKQITKVLLDFVLEKTDDDRSWDISNDIAKTAKLLFTETEAPHLTKLKEKSLDDFLQFSKIIRKNLKETETSVVALAQEVIDLIHDNGLEQKDFSGGYIYKHFDKLKSGDFNVGFTSKWQEQITEKPLYTQATAKKAPATAATIDGLAATLDKKFKQTKKLLFQQKLLSSALKNLIPLSVINLVQQELEKIKEEKNILPISEFNKIINEEIKNEPAPFIYERLGERYRHFFIDEFQDTSLLQWENLVPLIDNSLSQMDENQEHGSLLLVGDAKQSIYRWRGGLPEQFIDLYNHKNPFAISGAEVQNLPKNFRSAKDIIAFNNDFFTCVAHYFGNPTHTDLYKIGNEQETNSTAEGYVELSFLDTKEADDKDECYANKVHDIILQARMNNFSFDDICILTRRKKEGVALSQYLMEHEIPVVSQETLLLKSSFVVQFIINAITLSVYPEDKSVKIALLDFLHEHLDSKEEKHTFFTHFLKDDDLSFSNQLQEIGIDFSIDELNRLSIYEGCEYIIQKFGLASTANAYLYGFLDLVFEFEQQPQANTIRFLDHWALKQEKASISASEGVDAVQVMTIHKAKGLEFPVVIFPYANMDIYREIDAMTWFPLSENTFGFDEAYINYNKDVLEYGTVGEEMYAERQQTLELDSLNLLYVTLTRPVEQLYIVSEIPSDVKEGTPTKYSQLFMAFLQEKDLWDTDQHLYSFGKNQEKQSVNEPTEALERKPIFISSLPEKHGLTVAARDAMLWDTEAAVAIDTGNLLHDTMAMIKRHEDVEKVLTNLKNRNTLPENEFENLRNTVMEITTNHKLHSYFENEDEILNEREIITKRGLLLRPDRLNIHDDGSVTILDYKTGIAKREHEQQISIYAEALEEMNFNVRAKLLVYSQEGKIVVNKI